MTVALAVGFAVPPSSQAAEPEGASVSFKTAVADTSRTATVELRRIDDVAYVAVNSIIQQFGGGSSTLPGRIELDFLGRSAWVKLDDKSVNASLKQFQLRHNILRQGPDTLMALSDVVPFFKDAFGVDVSQELAAGERPEVRVREPETVVMEDLTLPDTREEAPLENLAPAETAQHSPQDRQWSMRTVIIDPGHGGNDVGCQSTAILEKDFTLAVARLTAKALEGSFDGRVVLTRAQDLNPPLEARARLAHAQRADLIISIHAGASMSPSAQGFELFVPPGNRLDTGIGNPVADTTGARKFAEQSAGIAHVLAREIAAATGAENRGVRSAPCRLFDEATAPCILVEFGALTNFTEAPKLADESYQLKLAQGIAEGLRACASGRAADGAGP